MVMRRKVMEAQMETETGTTGMGVMGRGKVDPLS